MTSVAAAAAFHAVAFDAVSRKSRLGVTVLWVAVVAATITESMLLSDLVAIFAVAVALIVYTALLLWCLRKLLEREPPAV
jgi:hypothetical protein